MNANVRKTNGVKLLALIAVFAMVFAGAAVMMSDNSVEAAPGDTTYLSGSVTATQEYGDGTNVVVNGNLTIPTGMAMIISGTGKLTIDAGATLTIQAGGQLIIQQTGTTGAYKNPTVTINGNIVAQGTISSSYTTLPTTGSNANQPVNAAYYGAIVNNSIYDADEKTGVFLNGSITLERGAEMWTSTEDLTADQSSNVIAIQITGTEGNVPVSPHNDDSECNGQIVLGSSASLNVNKRSSQISVIEAQGILMNQGATVAFNGYVNDVTVSATSTSTYYTAGSVTINGSDNTNTYEGENGSIRDTSNLTFTVTYQNTPALINNVSDSTKKDTQVTVRQYVVNINGTIDAGDVVTVNAAEAVCNNSTYADAVETDGYCKMTENGIVDTDAENIDMLSATVTGSLTVSDYAYNTINSTLSVDGYLTISGTANAQYTVSGGNVTYSAKVDVSETGTIFVTGAVNLHYNSVYRESTSSVQGGTIVVNGGKVTIYGEDVSHLATTLNVKLTAGAYTVVDETGNNPVSHLCDFDIAVTEAVAAGSDEVYVFSTGSNANATDAETAVDAGAVVIDTQITIPDDMTLYVYDALVVAENGELILQVGSIVDMYSGAKIYVQGKVTDHDYVMDEYDLDQFDYEVKKTTETDTDHIDTYTTLAIALDESAAGDEIELVKSVTVKDDLEIPADVTVITADVETPLTIESATLTVNGILEITGTGKTVALTYDVETETSNDRGTIVVNNIIRNATADTFIDGSANNVTVPGAYFQGQIGDDDEDTYYVTSAAVAGTNSTTTSAITIYGRLTMGNITFTQGDEALQLDITVYGQVNGNVTLAGNDVSLVMGAAITEDEIPAGTFTGSVTYNTTAGAATVDFSRAQGITLASDSMDDGTSVTTTLTMSGQLKGTATVSAGAVYISDDDFTVTYTAANRDSNIAEDKAVLTVASGATLYVPDGAVLTVNANGSSANAEAYAGLVVDGTLAIDEGTLTLVDADHSGSANPATYCNAQADINGTMTVTGNQTIAGVLNVIGTVNVAEDNSITVSRMYVGDSEGASGAVIGAVKFNGTGFVVAYPAADLTQAAIAYDETAQESDANVTEYYINGDLYMTSYAADDVELSSIIPAKIELVGYEDVIFGANADAGTSWFSDEAMTEPVYAANTNTVNDYDALYAEAEVSQALVYVSVGSNMSVFIDDVRYSNGAIIALDVGQHTISVQVNPGYTGETSVLIGGTAVTGGSFEITPEMAEQYSVPTNINSATSADCVVVSVTGNVSVDVPTTSGSSDDGMGLTDYLLIILVILIVVMAIMVAMRLMRS